MSKNIELKDVLAIDGGLQYIISRYPDAQESETNLKRKFKTRPEKTASASLKKMEDGTFIVTDFGGDSKGRNAVAVAQLEDGVDFVTALKSVAAFYQVEGSERPSFQAEYNSWPARPDEGEGSMNFDPCEFEVSDLRSLFSVNAWNALGHNEDARKSAATQLCAYYHFKCLKSYTYTTKGKTHKYSRTEHFPIFLIDEGEWKKLYKPKAEKQYRFQAYGKKPEVFIHGLAQAQKKVAQLVASSPDNAEEDLDDDGGKKKKKTEDKLGELIICTGGSDALNVAALGYDVVWMNSETAQLALPDYRTLCRLAKRIYNLPDIDATGKREAHKLAMEYLEIRTIWLPQELKNRRDGNGNPCKDVRDYLKHYRKFEFNELFSVALPYQFWDQEVAMDREGNVRMKFGKPLQQFVFNNVHAYNFLKANGFGRFESPKEKDGFFFVREERNIVKKIESSAVKDFIHNFLEERRYPVDLRNTMFRTPQLNESSIANLAFFHGDFTTYGPEYQYLFFKKATWRVTAAGISEEKPGQLDKNIWDSKVIDHDVKVLPDMFTITKEGAGYDIQIQDNSCLFFKFLIQTSRVHWRKELEERLDMGLLTPKEQTDYCERYGFGSDELKAMLHWSQRDRQGEYRQTYAHAVDGELLTEEEISDQKLHLINKIYAIGYLLHRYKNPAKPWAVYVMDAKISEDSESHGGAGKGIMAKALYRLLSKVQLDGRSPVLTENKHLYENVDADTDLIHLEDCHEFVPFGFFYAPITSSLTVNPKQKRSIEIPFEQSPKFLFDTNFGDRYTDPSSLRRKLYVAFSDYYHENNGEYRESRSPADEFGMNLFTDFDPAEWNRFFNFMAQCLKFYLGCTEKIGAPMDTVSKRNLISEMGDHFRNWADVFFAVESDRLDRLILKEEALEEFIRYSKLKNYTSQRFKKGLKAWCNFNGYTFNPKDLHNSQGLIIRKPEGVSKEFIYIQTPGAAINDIRI